MIKLFNKIRNFLTSTAGTPVTEPKMVTKELPVTEKIKAWEWTNTVDAFVDACIIFSRYMGKLIHSTLKWSICLYIAGYFVPELRTEVLTPLYNFVDLYLYCIKELADFLWELIMNLSV